MKHRFTLQPSPGDVVVQTAVNGRYLFVESATGEFEVIMPDRTSYIVTDQEYVDLGAEYVGGYTLRISNRISGINTILMSVAPVEIRRNASVSISGVVSVAQSSAPWNIANFPAIQDVKLVSPVPLSVTVGNFPVNQNVTVTNFPAVQDVALVSPNPIVTEEVYPDRVVSTGNVTIPASGTIPLSFSGCYGFSISPAQDCFWGGYDLSQALPVQHMSNKISTASQPLTGPAGVVVGWMRID